MLPFTQVDVFTDVLGLGNPVAVVHGADGLDTAAMARFARWTNLSETTFLLAPTAPGADYRLRIFTPARELPFAGHPTLGSAAAWLAVGGTPAREGVVVQQCGAGLVPVRRDAAVLGRLSFAAPPLVRSGPVSPQDLAALAAGLGVAPADVVDAAWVDNGPGWVGLLLSGAAAVLALEPDLDLLRRAGFPAVGVVGPHAPGADADVEVRAFVPEVGGGGEDPVTGSLAAGLGQWLTAPVAGGADSADGADGADGAAPRLPAAYTAAQGTRLGRRGRIRVVREGGDVWVGGDTLLGVTGAVALG